MFRVRDKIQNKWVEDGVYLCLDDGFSAVKKGAFGSKKILPVSDGRYVYHRDIGLLDCDKTLIYEGDIVRVEFEDDSIFNMLVTYISDIASYVLLEFNKYEYFPININNCKHIKVIGNVFDNLDLLPPEAYKEQNDKVVE